MSRLNPDRLRALREARNWSQSELARRAESTQPSINRLEAGGTDHPRNLMQLARALGTSPEYLTDQTDDPSPAGGFTDDRAAFHGFPAERDPDIVEIKHIDLRFGLGGTYIDGPVVEKNRRFSREWLREFTDASPDNLVWTRGDGNSMEPTIRDGEPILLDLSRNDLRMGDAIWAFAYGDIGMIKRLRPLPNGTIEILSDNKDVPQGNAADGEIHLVGRVIAVVRRI